jgi:hypothetical protein
MSGAARFRSRFRLLSARERGMLALGVAALVLFVGVRQFVYPKIDEYRKIRADIPRRLATIARYAVSAQGEGQVDALLSDRGCLLYDLETGLLPADNPAAAGAALQGMLKPWVERSKLRLTSLRALPPVVKGAYAEVAVQADVQGTTEGMAAFLAEVARQKKMLRVRKLSIASGMYSQVMAARPELLTVTFEVAAVTDAGAEEPGGKGGGE